MVLFNMAKQIKDICDKSQCTGCSACFSACPTGAIEMRKDEWGFCHPIIDQDKCIGCRMCIRSCQVCNPPSKNAPIDVFAAIAKEQHIYETSTSGGFCTAIAKFFLENGGVVYGAALDENFVLRHLRISDIRDLYKIQGSKYVDSNLDKIYQFVESDIKTIKTLFIGTPCNVGGLLAYLGNRDRENLFTVSFVCGGVSSTKLLKESLGSRLNGLRKLEFRRGTKYALWLTYGDGKTTRLAMETNPYMIGYCHKFMHRSSCFKCQYATNDRVGDITCGDFWGLKTGRFLNQTSKGVSVVISTTPKGQGLLTKTKDLFDSERHEFKETLEKNSRLSTPSEYTIKIDRFKRLYPRLGVNRSVVLSVGLSYWIFRLKKILWWDTINRFSKGGFRLRIK